MVQQTLLKDALLHVLPASEREHFGHGPFRVSRIRPGRIFGPDAAPAFGPLSVIDRATLTDGALVRMHEHVNDEILSWIWQGTMMHEDRAGHRIAISPSHLMLMNAGRSFWHEESVGGDTVEMLQIFVRPREADLTPRVQFWTAQPASGWRQIAGAEDSGAPLLFRQDIAVFDRNARAGDRFDAPRIEGFAPWLFVMSGAISIGGQKLQTGDAIAVGEHERLPDMTADAATTLVLFLVDRTASATRAGTISGR